MDNVKTFIRLGDKLVELDTNGEIPVIKHVFSKEIQRPDGGVDVEIHVPCMPLQAVKQ